MPTLGDRSWKKIFEDYGILKHDFTASPFVLRGQQIKDSCKGFEETSAKEVRILCKQDCREKRPEIFQEHGLFILPIKNGVFALIKGEGYVDIPDITSPLKSYNSNLPFSPDTSKVGNSEMQHLDYAYAASLIRNIMDDDSLVLTVRGRKYAPEFSFFAGEYKNEITARGVQTEVDAGYEGRDKILLVEAKNTSVKNVIIRQMYFPFRQWQKHTEKPVHLALFMKTNKKNVYCFWRFVFKNVNNYNSIQLTDSSRFSISQ